MNGAVGKARTFGSTNDEHISGIVKAGLPYIYAWSWNVHVYVDSVKDDIKALKSSAEYSASASHIEH